MILHNKKLTNCKRCGARVAWIEKQNRSGFYLANTIMHQGQLAVDTRDFHSRTCDPTGGNQAEIDLANREMNEPNITDWVNERLERRDDIAAPSVQAETMPVNSNVVQILERVFQQAPAKPVAETRVYMPAITPPTPKTSFRATYKCLNRGCAVSDYVDDVKAGNKCFQCGVKLHLEKLH